MVENRPSVCNRILTAALLCVLLMPAGPASALEIVSATPVKTENGKRADFVFAGSVTVRGILFEKNAVIMPVNEHGGRTYSDIKILSKALYKKIEACFFKKRCVAGGRVAPPKVSVRGVSRLNSDIRIANVFLSLDGDLSVTLGAVRRASGAIWASYPDDFEVSDAGLRSSINSKVEEAVRSLENNVKGESSTPEND